MMIRVMIAATRTNSQRIDNCEFLEQAANIQAYVDVVEKQDKIIYRGNPTL